MSSRSPVSLWRTLSLTILALTAFAANSVLCRLALDQGAIDASAFTTLRLFSGAVVLMILLFIKREHRHLTSKGSWLSSIMLFVYAAAFSFAYITLETGTGALLLFGAVQISMILMSLLSGNRLTPIEWLGISIAFAGFVYLILPGVSAPSVNGFLLMTIAGIAWGVYTLTGRGSQNPLHDTAYNFLRSLPFLIILLSVTFTDLNVSERGVWLAILSGGIASALGYTIWYAALSGLSATQAAVVQLLVPVLAALGGVIFVSEPITGRLVFSSVLILGGVSLCIFKKNREG